MPSTKPRLVARVDEKTKAAFDERAATLRLTSSGLLEQVVAAFLQMDPPKAGQLETPEPGSTKGRQKIDTRLSPKEVEALDALSQEMGWSRSKYLAQLFRVHLSGEPRFSEKEMLELRQVTMQLGAIGRNINQIARALNVSLDNANQAHAVQWEVMHKVIDVHRKYVKALVKGNLDYWGLNDGDE